MKPVTTQWVHVVNLFKNDFSDCYGRSVGRRAHGPAAIIRGGVGVGEPSHRPVRRLAAQSRDERSVQIAQILAGPQVNRPAGRGAGA